LITSTIHSLYNQYVDRTLATILLVQNVANDIGISSVLIDFQYTFADIAFKYSSYNLLVSSHINNLLASIVASSIHINLATVDNILALVPPNSDDIDNILFITGTL
jgi:hypothetical protein